jgi:hypothetical protein
VKLTASVHRHVDGTESIVLILPAQSAWTELPKLPSMDRAQVAEMCKHELIGALEDCPIEWGPNEKIVCATCIGAGLRSVSG